MVEETKNDNNGGEVIELLKKAFPGEHIRWVYTVVCICIILGIISYAIQIFFAGGIDNFIAENHPIVLPIMFVNLIGFLLTFVSYTSYTDEEIDEYMYYEKEIAGYLHAGDAIRRLDSFKDFRGLSEFRDEEKRSGAKLISRSRYTLYGYQLDSMIMFPKEVEDERGKFINQ